MSDSDLTEEQKRIAEKHIERIKELQALKALKETKPHLVEHDYTVLNSLATRRGGYSALEIIAIRKGYGHVLRRERE